MFAQTMELGCPVSCSENRFTAVGVVADWSYTFRNPQFRTTRFLSILNSGAGIHVASLTGTDQIVGLGVEINPSRGGGFTDIGSGHNLSDGSWHGYPAVDLFDLLGSVPGFTANE